MLWSGLRGRGWPLIVQSAVGIAIGLAGFLAFLRLGFGPMAAIGLVAAVGIGGFLDMPLWRTRRADPPFRVGLNVGGGLVPLLIAGQQSARMPPASLLPSLTTIFVVAGASFATARPVPNRGVFVPWLLPGMLAAALAWTLSPTRPTGVAFVAAVIGSFLGADLLTLPAIARIGADRAVFGGSGPFDGLLWTGMIAVFLTS